MWLWWYYMLSMSMTQHTKAEGWRKEVSSGIETRQCYDSNLNVASFILSNTTRRQFPIESVVFKAIALLRSVIFSFNMRPPPTTLLLPIQLNSLKRMLQSKMRSSTTFMSPPLLEHLPTSNWKLLLFRNQEWATNRASDFAGHARFREAIIS